MKHEKSVLLTQKFDQFYPTGHSNFRIPSADYADLLKLTSFLTHNHQDLLRAFRRMVFNVLAHNRDDHVKNFCYLLDATDREWSLSPAYDLIFSAGPGGEHSMTIAGEGRQPRRQHIEAISREAGISPSDRDAIIAEVTDAVARWPRFAKKAGVSQATSKQLAGEFPEL